MHQAAIIEFARNVGANADAAHDDGHLTRVVRSAGLLAAEEQADLDIVLPSAWLHDCVHVPKSSPERARASMMAADTATAFLERIDYPNALRERIHHAIAAHSFSARIAPTTVEACVVQDADRLDALGAIGVARCLMLGGQLARPLYDSADPFADHRAADDRLYTIDHFYAKLLTLATTMQTASGKAEAERRTAFMRLYLDQLRREV